MGVLGSLGVRGALSGLAAVTGATLVCGAAIAALETAPSVDPPHAPPVPVVAVAAVARDVPVTMEALGTVTASATVTVRSQVDGMLQELRFREGQEVRAGDVLARIEQGTYKAAFDQAIARRLQDEATLANARLDLARYQSLAQNSFASRQQVDTTRSTVQQLLGQVAQDAAQVEAAKVPLDHTVITAPVSGRIGLRQVDAGNIIHAADPNGIAVITNQEPITVEFSLPQQALRRVIAAMKAGSPEVLALPEPDMPDQFDRGTLTVLDNQVDQSTGTIKMKAEFPKAPVTLWPGEFVTVRLRLDVEHGAVVVPPTAVQGGSEGHFVFVVRDGGWAVRREVVLGPQNATGSVIERGLAVGEEVVTDGVSQLSDGARIVPTGVPVALGAAPRGDT